MIKELWIQGIEIQSETKKKKVSINYTVLQLESNRMGSHFLSTTPTISEADW